jgi:hypothetical protein
MLKKNRIFRVNRYRKMSKTKKKWSKPSVKQLKIKFNTATKPVPHPWEKNS